MRPLSLIEEVDWARWEMNSGYPFRPIGRDEITGLMVWPIEEYLARTNHGPRVAERIARLNPDGKVEGHMPRGWHPKAMRRSRRKMKRRA